VRLVSFSADGDASRPGLETDAAIADLGIAAQLAGYSAERCAELRHASRVVGLGIGALSELEHIARTRGTELRERGGLHAADHVRLTAPVPDPQKIICLGLNYRDHAAEAGLAPPSAPMFFAKYANSLVGPTDPIVPPKSTCQVDYEAELAVVIGRAGRNITQAAALDHVAGAMAFNDVSARDLQLANNLWTGGKAIDTFGPCGPALVTLDAIDDLQNLSVKARVNGETVQDGNTSSMIFGVAETIAFLSQIMTLEPGDIIATGTPAGVGNSRTPQLFLHPGDVVEVEIDGLGILRNPVLEAV
jgi:2-keto-4-pentenoate hydratase/2-oxohepta-3-ene-1,7-dioic acid hydratase in catechol pathway